MGICAVINCYNNHTSKIKMFHFPRDKFRRAKWVQFSRRNNWTPTSHSMICEFHFEKNQFEWHRQDGIIKLKPNAIPTIFEVPNPSTTINVYRKSINKKTVMKTSSNASETVMPLSQSDADININENSIQMASAAQTVTLVPVSLAVVPAPRTPVSIVTVSTAPILVPPVISVYGVLPCWQININPIIYPTIIYNL